MSILIVLVLSFGMPVRSQASIGGLLFDPIADLVVTVGDVIVSAFQNFFYDGTNFDALGAISNIFFEDYKSIPEMTYTR